MLRKTCRPSFFFTHVKNTRVFFVWETLQLDVTHQRSRIIFLSILIFSALSRVSFLFVNIGGYFISVLFLWAIVVLRKTCPSSFSYLCEKSSRLFIWEKLQLDVTHQRSRILFLYILNSLYCLESAFCLITSGGFFKSVLFVCAIVVLRKTCRPSFFFTHVKNTRVFFVWETLQLDVTHQISRIIFLSILIFSALSRVSFLFVNIGGYFISVLFLWAIVVLRKTCPSSFSFLCEKSSRLFIWEKLQLDVTHQRSRILFLYILNFSVLSRVSFLFVNIGWYFKSVLFVCAIVNFSALFRVSFLFVNIGSSFERVFFVRAIVVLQKTCRPSFYFTHVKNHSRLFVWETLQLDVTHQRSRIIFLCILNFSALSRVNFLFVNIG